MELIIIVLGFILDRVTKIWAKSLQGTDGIVVIKNFFDFSYLENRGAAFGIFQNKVIFLSIFTFMIIGGVIFYLFKYKPKSKFIRISLALIISGALGNLYDRVFYKYVVDFISLHYKEVYYYPTFNIADIMVVVGTIVLAISILKEEE